LFPNRTISRLEGTFTSQKDGPFYTARRPAHTKGEENSLPEKNVRLALPFTAKHKFLGQKKEKKEESLSFIWKEKISY